MLVRLMDMYFLKPNHIIKETKEEQKNHYETN
jgi:hypothetical protein